MNTEALALPAPIAQFRARAAAWWREHPQDDGGFGYASGGGHPSATSGSMTAAGIASLAQLAVATKA